jgi:protein-tyrosine kinase
MGLIEQAAKRLEELRRAGIEPPEGSAGEPEPPPLGPARPTSPPPPSSHPTAPSHPAAAARPDRPGGESPPRRPPLAIDLVKLAGDGFVTPDQPNSRIANEFRVIKRPLIANAASAGATRVRNGNLIMVTSAVPGEGKTFTSVNLAMSIAMELDRTVLLVDADVARPSLPRTLGVRDGPGLLDVLGAQAVPMAEVLHHTNVPKLTFLSSGQLHPRAAEVLASEAMVRFLAELSDRYSDRIIIFDSPPLLVTTEALALASRVGQIVFVVNAQATLQQDVRRALATIEACPVKLTVLNKAKSTGQGTYGYGYGYGYGRGPGDADGAPK